MEAFYTLHGSLVDSAQSSTLQLGRKSHALVAKLSDVVRTEREMQTANASSGISSTFTTF